MDEGLASEQPGVVGNFAQTFVQRGQRRAELALLLEPLGLLGEGFHLLTAPLELLPAAARARSIRIDRGHGREFLDSEVAFGGIRVQSSRAGRTAPTPPLERGDPE